MLYCTMANRVRGYWSDFSLTVPSVASSARLLQMSWQRCTALLFEVLRFWATAKVVGLLSATPLVGWAGRTEQ